MFNPEGKDEIFFPENLIELSGDKVRKEQLEEKLKEYKKRLERPDLNEKSKKDYSFRIFILNKLLELGKVDLSETMDELEGEVGFDREIFMKSWNIIEAYNNRDGEGLRGGTGLPDIEKD